MVIATTDGPIFANVPSKPNELLKFRREICVNRLFALLAGLMDLRAGDQRGLIQFLPVTLPLNPSRIRSPWKSSFLSAI